MQTRDTIITLVGAVALVGVVLIAAQGTEAPANTILSTDAPVMSRSKATQGPLGVSVVLEHPKVTRGARHGTAMIELTSVPGTEAGAREPLSLVLVADASGSMAGNKLDNSKRAMHDLIDKLTPGDSLSLVSFAERARVELTRHQVTERGNEAAHAAVDALVIEGWTCVSCGLSMAYQLLGSAPEGHQRRVLMLSDGESNRGVLDSVMLGKMTSQALGTEGITTSTIGIGRGIDAPLLASLASLGAGGYYFLRNSIAIPEVIGAELAKAAPAAATSVNLEITLAEGVRLNPAKDYLGARFENQRMRLGRFGWNKSRRFLVPLFYDGAVPPESPISVRVLFDNHEGRSQHDSATASLEIVSNTAQVEAARRWNVTTESVSLQSASLTNNALQDLAVNNMPSAEAKLKQARTLIKVLEGHAEASTVENLNAGVDKILDRLVEFTPGSDTLKGAVLLGHACQNELSQGVGIKDAYHQPDLHGDKELE